MSPAHYLVARKSPFIRVTKVGLWRGVFHSLLPGPDLYRFVEAGREDLATYWQDINSIAAVGVPQQGFDERAGSPINYLYCIVQTC